jgi:hypothetical protein
MMNMFAEHYIPAPAPLPYIGPRTLRLARILFDLTHDVPGSVQKYEQMGFTRIGSSEDQSSHDARARDTFYREAATIGASLVVSQSAPAAPYAVYFAPTSRHARQLDESALGCGSVMQEISDVPSVAASHLGPITYKVARVRSDYTNDLLGTVDQWEKAGFLTLGLSEVVGKNDVMGFSDDLGHAAVAVGASLVVFQVTPAKLRAVRRSPDGRIDMDVVRANSPASFNPRGCSVVQAVFLAPTSIQAGELAEAQLGGTDIPIEVEE